MVLKKIKKLKGLRTSKKGDLRKKYPKLTEKFKVCEVFIENRQSKNGEISVIAPVFYHIYKKEEIINILKTTLNLVKKSGLKIQKGKY